MIEILDFKGPAKNRANTLMISGDPEVVAAFNAVCAGLRDPRHRQNIQGALPLLSDARHRALKSPMEIDWSTGHPILRPREMHRPDE
jgi:hypothetical protein